MAYSGALLNFMPRSDGKSDSGKTAPTKTTGKSKKASEQVHKIKIGPPKLTRFERARILGARSLQLALGAPPFIAFESNIKDPISLALAEIEANALPISIRRRLPDGKYQDIAIDWLR